MYGQPTLSQPLLEGFFDWRVSIKSGPKLCGAVLELLVRNVPLQLLLLAKRFKTRQNLQEGEYVTELEPGPARGGFRGYIVPGPERAQVSTLIFRIPPKHRNQTCLQQKYQSAYSVLVIGRYFCYTAFRGSNSGPFD